jgi:hypothetical protein
MNSHRSVRVVRPMVTAILAVVLCVAAETTLFSQDRLNEYETQYQNEKDPVRKARLLGQIGPLQIDRARTTFKDGQDEKALDMIGRYRDQVRAAWDALLATGVNPVKKPAGFKELQIGLRVTLRRLDDFILGIPQDKQPWFRGVRTDIAETENRLIDALFGTEKTRASQ